VDIKSKNQEGKTDMKRMKKLNAVLLVFMMLFTVAASTAEADAASVRLNKKSVTLETGQSAKLKVKGSKRTVKWKSSNKKIVKVTKKGKVTAKKAGKATITAKVGKKKLKCKVTVVAPQPAPAPASHAPAPAAPVAANTDPALAGILAELRSLKSAMQAGNLAAAQQPQNTQPSADDLLTAMVIPPQRKE
jgi:hypothetical protein